LKWWPVDEFLGPKKAENSWESSAWEIVALAPGLAFEAEFVGGNGEKSE
jgi:hypothetical protein